MRIARAVIMLLIGAWSLGSGILSLSLIPMGSDAYEAGDEALRLSDEIIREAAPDLPPLGDDARPRTAAPERSAAISRAHRGTGALLVLAGLLSLLAGVSLWSRCMPALLWIAISFGVAVEAISVAWLREGPVWPGIKAAVLLVVGLSACRGAISSRRGDGAGVAEPPRAAEQPRTG